MIHRTRPFVAASAFACLLVAPTAMAQGAGAPSYQVPQVASSPASVASADDQELARLDQLLKRFSSESNDYRLWGGVSGLAMGAVAIPAGVVMINQYGESLAGPLVLGAGIGSAIGGGLLLISPFGPFFQFQAMSEALDEERAKKKSSREIIARVEFDWEKRAKNLRSFRKVLGGVAIGAGVLELAGGAYLAFAQPSNPEFTKSEQYGFSGALIGLGTFSVFVGLQSLFFQDPVEASWNTYSSLKPLPAPTSPRITGLGTTPLPGGGAVTFGGTF